MPTYYTSFVSLMHEQPKSVYISRFTDIFLCGQLFSRIIHMLNLRRKPLFTKHLVSKDILFEDGRLLYDKSD